MNKTELRKKLLDEADAIIEAVSKASSTRVPGSELMPAQLEALKHIWPTIHSIVVNADDPAPPFDTEGSAAKAALSILTKLSKGEVTPGEAKKMMEVVGQVFDTTELPALIEQLIDYDKSGA